MPVRTEWELFLSKNRLGKPSFDVAIRFVAVLAGLAGCRGPVTRSEGKPALELTSSSFVGGEIAKRFTCDGAESSPELAWTAPPAATRSFALIVVDRDAPLFSFVHWVLYDLPAEKRELAEVRAIARRFAARPE